MALAGSKVKATIQCKWPFEQTALRAADPVRQTRPHVPAVTVLYRRPIIRQAVSRKVSIYYVGQSNSVHKKQVKQPLVFFA